MSRHPASYRIGEEVCVGKNENGAVTGIIQDVTYPNSTAIYFSIKITRNDAKVRTSNGSWLHASIQVGDVIGTTHHHISGFTMEPNDILKELLSAN